MDFIETDSYEVNNGKIVLKVIIRKSDILKLDKFINKVVSDYNISNYEFKKIAESKLEDNEEV